MESSIPTAAELKEAMKAVEERNAKEYKSKEAMKRQKQCQAMTQYFQTELNRLVQKNCSTSVDRLIFGPVEYFGSMDKQVFDDTMREQYPHRFRLSFMMSPRGKLIDHSLPPLELRSDLLACPDLDRFRQAGYSAFTRPNQDGYYHLKW